MTFTYSPNVSGGDLTDLHKVRLAIGDTDKDHPLFQDEEINVYIDAAAGNLDKAAADLAQLLATRFARAYDFETDGQRFVRSQMFKHYSELAETLRERASGVATRSVTRVDGYSDDVRNTDVDLSQQKPRRRFYGQEDAIP